ncbi:toxin-antitoxin system YwqK family antitoxin [Tenacibaculum sp. SDUM215027]|uniref:toxin-antitoxin system YwqK family antitoxin n=1 Tax=Tenacibaculum sp. SDUM215027 TaxID=3422596 RepID=UPI003D31DE0D
MKLPIITLLITLFTATTFAQQDTLWFDGGWDKTTKDKAHFYRPLVKKEKRNLYRINDYYINGNLQMTGLSKFKDALHLEGAATWYRHDGNVMQTETYKDNKLNGVSTYYKYVECDDKPAQKVISGVEYINEASADDYCIYNIREITYKDNHHIKEIRYDTDKNGAREVYYYKKGRIHKKMYYDTNGKLIGTYYLPRNGNEYGVTVSYYSNPVRPKEITTIKEGYPLYTQAYYPNGQKRSSFDTIQKVKTYYDEKGKVMGKLQYEGELNKLLYYNGKRYTFYPDGKTIEKIETYDSEYLIKDEEYNGGVLIRENFYDDFEVVKTISYSDTGKKIGEFTKKDNELNGTIRNKYNQIITYKNSFPIKATIPYINSRKLFSTLKDSVITYHDTLGNPIATLKVGLKKGKYFPDRLETGEYTPLPIEGTLVMHDHKQRITNEITFKNYKKIQKTTFDYIKDKCFKQHILYDNNEEPLKHTFYFSNGNKQYELFFNPATGKKEKGIFYNKNGKQISEFNYQTKTGTFYEFYDNSDDIKEVSTQKNGQFIAGKRYQRVYDRSLKTYINVLRQDVIANGESTFYSKKGTVIGKALFKNGNPWSGTVFNYHTHKKFEFKEGKKHGIYIDYTGDEKTIRKQGHYENGEKHGAFITWGGVRTSYGSKNIQQKEENYKQGVRDGYTIKYNKVGKEISKVLYKNGKREGYATSYNEKTNKTYRLLYKNDKPFEGVTVNRFNDEKVYVNGNIVKETNHTDVKTHNNTYQTIKTIINHKDKATKEVTVYDLKDNKLLSYSEKYDQLHGEVIKYHNNKPKHIAVFKDGDLQTGEVWLSGMTRFESEKYFLLSKQDSTVSIKIYNQDLQLISHTAIKPSLYKDYNEQQLLSLKRFDLAPRSSVLLIYSFHKKIK